MNIRKDWRKLLTERGIRFQTWPGNGIALYRGDAFLRSVLWNPKEGIPQNPVELTNWVLWYERNFLNKPVDKAD
jgi:hypothetical protein